MNGANFSPEYLKINTAGTVPTCKLLLFERPRSKLIRLDSVVVPQLASAVDESVSTKYTAITDSVAICEFLDTQRTSDSRGDAPARSLSAPSISEKTLNDELIALVHSPKADPNFLLLSARSEAELSAKAKDVPGQFISGRKKALEGYLQNTDLSGRMENFLREKLQAMNGMQYVYENPSSKEAADFLAKGQQHWLTVGEILVKVSSMVPKEDRSGFVTLADLHVGGWFARILACTGAKELKDVDASFASLYKAFGRKEEELIGLKNWWAHMVQRQRYEEAGHAATRRNTEPRLQLPGGLRRRSSLRT